MGWFGNIWIMQLKEDSSGEVKNFVEQINFNPNAYISWESANLNEVEWTPKAEKTLFIKKGGRGYGDPITYEMQNVTPVNWGTLRKERRFEIQSNLTVDAGICILHLMLPKLFIPEIKTFSKTRQVFIKKTAERITLTWSFHVHLSIHFRFRKVDLEEFNRFETVGSLKTVRVDPDIVSATKTAVEYAGILTKLAVDLKP
jgi:hypothetical protein